MKVIYDSNGQLCNRFWSYIETVAEAIVKKQRVRIWQWDSNIRYFDRLREGNPYVSFPYYNKNEVKKLGDAACQDKVKRFVEHPFWGRLLGTSCFRWLGFVNGWSRRCETVYYPQVRVQIAELFKPNNNIVKECEQLLLPYKTANNLIVGVHIRRGDYKDFVGGRFYFSDDEYCEYMQQIVDANKERNCIFFIASNEPVSNIFKRFEVIKFGGANITPAHDLYGLGLCDLIIGPISTFSRWAAYMGDVPLCFLDRTSSESPLIFRRLQNYSHFVDGTEIPSMTKLQNEYTGWKPTRFYKRWISIIK